MYRVEELPYGTNAIWNEVDASAVCNNGFSTKSITFNCLTALMAGSGPNRHSLSYATSITW
jgi:hypothetical protein